MSIYSNLKELYKDTNDIVNGKNIAWKIIYMLQNISFIIICMICLVDKCKIRTIIPENIEFGLSQSVCNFLNKYIVICIIFYFGYLVILTPIIKILYVKLKTEYNKNIIPIWYTIDDIIKILLNIMILIVVIQYVMLVLNREYVFKTKNIIIPIIQTFLGTLLTYFRPNVGSLNPFLLVFFISTDCSEESFLCSSPVITSTSLETLFSKELFFTLSSTRSIT